MQCAHAHDFVNKWNLLGSLLTPSFPKSPVEYNFLQCCTVYIILHCLCIFWKLKITCLCIYSQSLAICFFILIFFMISNCKTKYFNKFKLWSKRLSWLGLIYKRQIADSFWHFKNKFFLSHREINSSRFVSFCAVHAKQLKWH